MFTKGQVTVDDILIDRAFWSISQHFELSIHKCWIDDIYFETIPLSVDAPNFYNN